MTDLAWTCGICKTVYYGRKFANNCCSEEKMELREEGYHA